MIENWDWHKWYPISEIESKLIWNDIKQSKNFWESLELINATEFEYLKTVLNNNFKIVPYFITSRIPTVGNNLHQQCINSLIKFGWKSPQVILSNKKENIINAFEIEYFIDDKGENCLDVKDKNPNCNVYILDYPYNSFVSDKHINRIYTLNDFAKILEKI